MNNPKVSVIVPVYNSEKYLIRCIESILAQTFTDFECIMIDDCSPDECPEICDDFARKNNKIKVIHNENNKGIALTRKIGLDASTGEYVLYVDSDDYIEKNMIEKMYKTAVAEGLDFLACDYFYEKENNVKIFCNKFSNINEKTSVIKDIIAIRIIAGLWNKLVKRDLYLKAVYPKYNFSEDYVINIQNIYNSNKIGFIDIPLYHYVYNNNSLSANKDIWLRRLTEENKNWQIIIAYLREKYGKNLKIFEPELSRRINGIKNKYLQNKELRFKRELFKLYPESKFCSKYFLGLIKKMIKFVLKRKNKNARI